MYDKNMMKKFMRHALQSCLADEDAMKLLNQLFPAAPQQEYLMQFKNKQIVVKDTEPLIIFLNGEQIFWGHLGKLKEKFTLDEINLLLEKEFVSENDVLGSHVIRLKG